MDPLSEIYMNSQEFNYDSIAADYATKVDSAPYNALYERPAMLALLPPLTGLRILDAGCGSGWYAARLIERGAALDAVDASAAMVDYARAKLEESGLLSKGRASLRVADLADPLAKPERDRQHPDVDYRLAQRADLGPLGRALAVGGGDDPAGAALCQPGQRAPSGRRCGGGAGVAGGMDALCAAGGGGANTNVLSSKMIDCR